MRESALQTNVPLIPAPPENAPSTDVRFIGSENVIAIKGVVDISPPTGIAFVTNGRVTSTTVHVSFPLGAASTFPARSVAIDRKAYAPSEPAVNVPEVGCVVAGQSIQPEPALYCMVEARISVTPRS